MIPNRHHARMLNISISKLINENTGLENELRKLENQSQKMKHIQKINCELANNIKQIRKTYTTFKKGILCN